jgi:hypothetical protein
MFHDPHFRSSFSKKIFIKASIIILLYQVQIEIYHLIP